MPRHDEEFFDGGMAGNDCLDDRLECAGVLGTGRTAARSWQAEVRRVLDTGLQLAVLDLQSRKAWSGEICRRRVPVGKDRLHSDFAFPRDGEQTIAVVSRGGRLLARRFMAGGVPLPKRDMESLAHIPRSFLTEKRLERLEEGALDYL